MYILAFWFIIRFKKNILKNLHIYLFIVKKNIFYPRREAVQIINNILIYYAVNYAVPKPPHLIPKFKLWQTHMMSRKSQSSQYVKNPRCGKKRWDNFHKLGQGNTQGFEGGKEPFMLADEITWYWEYDKMH
jgi:hypothetical protein